jgi:hypothetical protein
MQLRPRQLASKNMLSNTGINTAAKNIAIIQDIRRRMLNGELTYDEAKAEAAPTIAAINAKSVEVAKKYNRKAVKLSFAAIMR